MSVKSSTDLFLGGILMVFLVGFVWFPDDLGQKAGKVVAAYKAELYKENTNDR